MNNPDLLTISISAFIAVFFLLSFLSLLMKIIISIFPEKTKKDDLALYAAISTNINKIYPNSKITHIEEV